MANEVKDSSRHRKRNALSTSNGPTDAPSRLEDSERSGESLFTSPFFLGLLLRSYPFLLPSSSDHLASSSVGFPRPHSTYRCEGD
jgi:hypothetical protein